MCCREPVCVVRRGTMHTYCCCVQDLQLLHNHTIIHTRTAFKDYDVRTLVFTGRVCRCSQHARGPCVSACLPASLHTRTQDPARRRHLLRLWLAPPAEDRAFPLAAMYAEQWYSTQAGDRGGIRIEVRG